MVCNNCPHFHKVTKLTYTAGTSLVIETTNSTNISSLEPYCFVLPCSINPKTVVTGAPVQCYMTINGTNYQLYNKYSLPLYSNELTRRKLYKGWFVVDPDDSTNAWIHLKDFPDNRCCKK